MTNLRKKHMGPLDLEKIQVLTTNKAPNGPQQEYSVQCPPPCAKLSYYNLFLVLRWYWLCVKSTNLLVLYGYSATTLLEYI